MINKSSHSILRAVLSVVLTAAVCVSCAGCSALMQILGFGGGDDPTIPGEHDIIEGESWTLGEGGFEVGIPDVCGAYEDVVYLEPYGEMLDGDVCYGYVGFFPASGDDIDRMSDDEIYALFDAASYPLLIFGIGGEGTADELRLWFGENGWDDPESVSFAGRSGDRNFYHVVFSDMNADAGYEGEILEAYTAVSDAFSPGAVRIRFFEPYGEGSGAEAVEIGGTVRFGTETLGGTPVDSAELFAANRITVVNLWASWCGPCVGELEELEELNSELAGKGCGVVGILCDGDDPAGKADAEELIAGYGLTYPMLMPAPEIFDAFPLSAYPTTYLVDSEGRIVGGPIVGAYVEKYRAAAEELLGE